MAYHRGRLVADPPARRVQPPDQVHVLAQAQPGIEHVRRRDRPQRGPAGQQRGGRHVGQPGTRRDPALLAAHVQAGARGAVPVGPAPPAGNGQNPRGGHGHRWIRQVRREPFDPAGLRDTIAIAQRHQLAGHASQAGVSRGRGAAVGGTPQQCGAVPGDHGGDRGRVGRAVVHHQDRVAAAHRAEAAVQQPRPVQDRDQHGHVGLGGQRGWPRVGQARVGQPAGQRARGGAAHRAVPQLGHGPLARPGQPEHPGGRAAEERGVV